MDFTEDDLVLVHALQIAPRARWADLAPVLGAAPATLARRWTALRTAGLAWTTAYETPMLPSKSVIGFVELQCEPGRLDDVVQRLERRPGVVTIDHAASGPDLTMMVAAESFAGMSSLVIDTLTPTPGVRSMRTHLISRVHMEAGHWRLDAMSTAQQDAVHAIEARRERGPAVDLRSVSYAPLVRELTRDGRASAADLAARLGRPPATVRRQLGALLRSGSIALRCDIAQMHTRWPVNVTWWCRVPGADVDAVVRHVRSDARVRQCMSLTGPANLVVAAWTASMSDLMHLQAKLEKAMPSGEIMDVTVALRSRKRLGWLLHADGRCTGDIVPAAAGGDR